MDALQSGSTPDSAVVCPLAVVVIGNDDIPQGPRMLALCVWVSIALVSYTVRRSRRSTSICKRGLIFMIHAVRI